MKLFYLSEYNENEDGFLHNSKVSVWYNWLRFHIPSTPSNKETEEKLAKNLAHIILGLEMKAGLILAHQRTNQSILYDPYLKIMSFEFCVGVFSICEGLGSIIVISQNPNSKKKIKINEWKKALCDCFDSDETLNIKVYLETVIKVRNKIHQDKIHKRDSIDYHSFAYKNSFEPALTLIQSLLEKPGKDVPKDTNLKSIPI
jgi:hypothetical protein